MHGSQFCLQQKADVIDIDLSNYNFYFDCIIHKKYIKDRYLIFPSVAHLGFDSHRCSSCKQINLINRFWSWKTAAGLILFETHNSVPVLIRDFKSNCESVGVMFEGVCNRAGAIKAKVSLQWLNYKIYPQLWSNLAGSKKKTRIYNKFCKNQHFLRQCKEPYELPNNPFLCLMLFTAKCPIMRVTMIILLEFRYSRGPTVSHVKIPNLQTNISCILKK